MKTNTFHRLVFNFRAARAIIFAAEIGLFEALSQKPEHLESLAKTLSTKKDELNILLNALLAIKVISKNEKSYYIHESLTEALTLNGRDSLKNLLILDSFNWNNWSKLDTLFFDDVSKKHVFNKNNNYSIAMQQRIHTMNDGLVKIISELNKTRILDIGSGPGSLAKHLINRDNNTNIILMDFENVIQQARCNLADLPQERIMYVVHDILEGTSKIEAEIIVASRLLMGFRKEEVEKILDNIFQSLAPDGILIINEFNTSTQIGALMSLDMLVNCQACVYEESYLSRTLAKRGVHFMHTLPTSSFTHAMCFQRG